MSVYGIGGDASKEKEEGFSLLLPWTSLHSALIR